VWPKVQGPRRYQSLAETDRGQDSDHDPEPAANQRRESLKLVEGRARIAGQPPSPAPKPSGELLAQIDPQRAARGVQIKALNELARSGKIDWAEWQKRVRGSEPAKTDAADDHLAEARATAEDARRREAAEAQRTPNQERER
jgi:hypothetical protein